MEKKYKFEDLLQIMERLRSDNGCPWDKEQTIESLKKYLLEESYEVLDAIEEDDKDKHAEELGDVLLQIVFQCQITKEDGLFDIEDVINSICTKLVHRHPHVFGQLDLENAAQVEQEWELIKKEEKGFESYTEIMKKVPKNLPSLMRSYKVQKKAADVGFDWDNVDGAFSKVYEETEEIKEVYKTSNKEKIEDEVGDLLFAVVNVSRMLGVEPETALNSTIKKFIRRFEYIEQTAINTNKDIKNMSLEEMDKLWEEAKVLQKN